MKALIFALFTALFACSSGATVTTFDLSHLEGQTIVPFDESNQEEAFVDFSFNVGFDVGEVGFEQFELKLNFDDVNLTQKSQLVLLIENDYFSWFDIHPFEDTVSLISYRGISGESLSVWTGGTDVGNFLSFSIMLDHWVDDGFEYGPNDYVTFGAGSYITITDEPEGIRPYPVPEPETFALFLLGAVGLCVRRQIKANATLPV